MFKGKSDLPCFRLERVLRDLEWWLPGALDLKEEANSCAGNPGFEGREKSKCAGSVGLEGKEKQA